MGCAASSQGANAAQSPSNSSAGSEGKGIDAEGYVKGRQNGGDPAGEKPDHSTSIHVFAVPEAAGKGGKKQVGLARILPGGNQSLHAASHQLTIAACAVVTCRAQQAARKSCVPVVHECYGVLPLAQVLPLLFLCSTHDTTLLITHSLLQAAAAAGAAARGQRTDIPTSTSTASVQTDPVAIGVPPVRDAPVTMPSRWDV